MFIKFKKLRIIKPFNNRRAGGMVSTLTLILFVFAFIMTLTWSGLRAIESFAQSRVDTLCYRLVDAIATTGEINEGIQDDLYPKFNKMNFYASDYKIEYYKYTYNNAFNKTYLGTSTNGSKIPTVALNRGEMIQVVYKANSTSLDGLYKILDPGSENIGLSGEGSMKVD